MITQQVFAREFEIAQMFKTMLGMVPCESMEETKRYISSHINVHIWINLVQHAVHAMFQFYGFSW